MCRICVSAAAYSYASPVEQFFFSKSIYFELPVLLLSPSLFLPFGKHLFETVPMKIFTWRWWRGEKEIVYFSRSNFRFSEASDLADFR
jgi:hypothetical protein